MKHFHAAVSLAALLIAVPALAEPTGETTRMTVQGTQIDYGNLHLAANLVGWNLALGDGPVSSVHGLYQLGDRLAVRAHVVTPALGVIGSTSPVRIEAAGLFLPRVEVRDEREPIDVGAEDGKRFTIDMAVPNKNHYGLGLGLLYRTESIEADVAGKTFEQRANYVTAVVGLAGLNTSGIEGTTERFGAFSHTRWMTGGLDLLVDVVQSYDKDPDDVGRFGGRLWAESMFGKTVGLSGRLEIGHYPGGTGWVLLAAIGGGIHLGL